MASINYVSQNITTEIKNYINTKGVVFNPSISHFKDFIYIVSVRNYVYDNFLPKSTLMNPYKNHQHPWKHFWKKSEHTEDKTYIFPAEIRNIQQVLNSNISSSFR